jgi:signal transduction histidine kinase
MTTIKGYASLLGKEDLPPEMRQKFSDIITRSVDSFVEMTQEILDYARGGGPLQAASVPLDAFLHDLCDFVEPGLKEHGLSLSRKFAYSGQLTMDETKMRRALYNIISNAADAMQAGGSLTVSTLRTDNRVEIRLADTGPGIPEAIQDSLFEPFVTHGKARGTGLGLAIAHKTVRDHGGTISVNSVAGEGATFILQMPLG